MNILRSNLDYFDVVKQTNPNVLVFTGNGVITKNEELVMGGGIALAFKNKFPWLPFYIGNDLKDKPGKVKKYGVYGPIDSGTGKVIFALQTKLHFKDDSDLQMVIDNTKLLFEKTRKYSSILTTVPGAGLGNLDMDTVLVELDKILDKRFIVLCPQK